MSLFEKDCSHVPPPMPLSIFTTTISVGLIFFTVPSNFLICLAVYKERRTLLRNAFNCLLVNLALADLIVGIVVLTISTYVHFLEAITNHPDLPVLPVGHVSYFICCTASTLSLTAMAADRYIAVVHPVIYRNRITPARALIASICIWLVSIALPLALYFQVGFIKYAFVFANTAIVAMLMVFFFSYSICRKLHAQFEMSSQLQSRLNSQSQQRRALEYEKRIAKTFVSHNRGLSHLLYSFKCYNLHFKLLPNLQLHYNSLVSRPTVRFYLDQLKFKPFSLFLADS